MMVRCTRSECNEVKGHIQVKVTCNDRFDDFIYMLVILQRLKF